METYCANCGKKMNKPPALIIKSRFCSDVCKDFFNAKLQAELSVSNWRTCAHCGDIFLPTTHQQIYCSKKCCILAQNKRNREERASAKKELNDLKKETFVENKKTTSFEQISREADECGLSYGKYRAQLMLGKTYEELKAAYESRR